MASRISAKQRLDVQARDQLRCARCLCGALTGQWHHRRGRAVRDDHSECTCNGVWLCIACHTWVHANPFMARQSGFIVSRYEDQPGTIPVTMSLGTRYMDCQGGYKFA